jgi:L-ascorbate metabolism protein UlaG (beta-lactamase superfamily)
MGGTGWMAKTRHAGSAIAAVAIVTFLRIPPVLPNTIHSARPSHVDITWMSIANVYYELGSFRVLTDGYITRLPQSAFFGGGGDLGETRRPFTPDVNAVTRVFTALGGRSSVNVLLTGHSHFDHSFDTPTWSKLTGARIIGSKTTCFQAMAEEIPPGRCTPVYGGETIPLLNGVTLRVVRWNHSGSAATNPEQHNAVEIEAPPRRDPTTGGLRAGVAEDFPNGGGTRAFLFVVDGPGGRFSWLYQNSGSAVDLDVPIVAGRTNYGAPIENLKAAMKAAGLESVDLWIGTGGLAVAQLVVPVLKPKAYLPIHWDGLWGKFEAGVPQPYSDPPLEQFLRSAGINLLRPEQYFDKWRLDRKGVRPISNAPIKHALGFK